MLFIAALYFVVWGVLVMLFPHSLHAILVETNETPLIFWDLIAVFTIVLGVGLLIAAFDPFRNWLIMFINLLFHIGIIAGFLIGWSDGHFSSNFLPFLFFNHVIWLLPLSVGLLLVYRRNFQTDRLLIDTFNEKEFPLEMFETASGKNLQELSEQDPVLLVFLRHFGCPFCQETLLEIKEKRAELENGNIQIIMVHMANPMVGNEYLAAYGLEDLEQLSDPESIAYKRFKLHRGNMRQLLGIKVLYRWLVLGIKKHIYLKKVEGDLYQMPGFFLLRNGEIVRQFVHKSSADRPNYEDFLSYSDN